MSFLLILSCGYELKIKLEFQFRKSEFWQHFAKFSNELILELLQMLFFELCFPADTPSSIAQKKLNFKPVVTVLVA